MRLSLLVSTLCIDFVVTFLRASKMSRGFSTF